MVENGFDMKASQIGVSHMHVKDHAIYTLLHANDLNDSSSSFLMRFFNLPVSTETYSLWNLTVLNYHLLPVIHCLGYP